MYKFIHFIESTVKFLGHFLSNFVQCSVEEPRGQFAGASGQGKCSMFSLREDTSLYSDGCTLNTPGVAGDVLQEGLLQSSYLINLLIIFFLFL